MEISLVSIERVKEYIDREPETKYRLVKQFPDRIPAHWPSHGRIQFLNYCTSYAEINSPNDTPDSYVLKNINITMDAGKQIAIVGRTGAGKSSIVLALFQLLQSRRGTILIDGVDCAAIDLQRLRSSIAIIPQQPMVYPGSVRDNLDPAGVYSDKSLWNALEQVGLAKFVWESAHASKQAAAGDGKGKALDPRSASSPEAGKVVHPLDTRFPGEKLSVGQKQLFCFCRAILLQSKIVVLDEPTASIDQTTDQMIQKVIRKVFKGCTVITIAHRITTILDFDMVMVLEQGQVLEYGVPSQLLRNPSSAFYSLANA
jgi:ATP-binding cassette subfamily C (CFTR/MRP) protein 1